jgi:hypothetical protein
VECSGSPEKCQQNDAWLSFLDQAENPNGTTTGPQLVSVLCLAGGLITIDAMECQKGMSSTTTISDPMIERGIAP